MKDYLDIAKKLGLNEAMTQLETDILLTLPKDSITKQAEFIRVPRTTLRDKLNKLGLRNPPLVARTAK